jgi:hypothetical protein
MMGIMFCAMIYWHLKDMAKLSVVAKEHGQKKKFWLVLMKKARQGSRTNFTSTQELTVEFHMVDLDSVLTEYALG